MKLKKPRIMIAIAIVVSMLTGQAVHAASFFEQSERLTGSHTAQSPAKHEVIGQFSTKFNKNSKARTHNLKLSSIAIDQYVIEPGDTFSFNDVVGYAGPQQGYQEAVIFVKGEEKKAYGGGICQVSSTLYNAAMAAGLEIVERHPHSKEVHYVEKGKDAATSYGSVDLKFKNNFTYPVTINTYISEDTFTAEILK